MPATGTPALAVSPGFNASSIRFSSIDVCVIMHEAGHSGKHRDVESRTAPAGATFAC